VAEADQWAVLDDEILYLLVPTQQIPRAFTPSQYLGCPLHGGNRSTLFWSWEDPFRWKCDLGGEWWYDGQEVQKPPNGEMVRVADTGAGWTAPEGFLHPGETYFFVGPTDAGALVALLHHLRPGTAQQSPEPAGGAVPGVRLCSHRKTTYAIKPEFF